MRRGEEEAACVTGAAAVGAGHQLLSLARLAVALLVPQTEVTVVVGDDAAVHRLLGCQRGRTRTGWRVKGGGGGGGGGGDGKMLTKANRLGALCLGF